ncbi:hypothetical protein DL767_001062 [Monosporascus sp. MG133]|nr:hypothetical protein DL767_001062 [Monosporascus sp. MG133]
MPSKHQKYASKSSRCMPRRGSSSAGPRLPDHARRHERPHPSNIDGCDLESEMDSEVNRYNGTTSPISSSDGYDENSAAHRDSTMESAYDPSNAGVVSHSGAHSSGSTLHRFPSNQRNDRPLLYGTSSGNTYSAARGSSATDGAVYYADTLFTVGRETAPTDRSQRTSASRVDDQYASSGAQGLRANDGSGEAGSYVADAHGSSVSRNARYSSLGPYVGNEDPVLTDANAGVDINQPAQATAHHSPPSSVDANMGSAQVSPVVQQQRVFEAYQRTTMDERPHWTFAHEGPWNPYDAARRYHH